jgi:hypothetical protein
VLISPGRSWSHSGGPRGAEEPFGYVPADRSSAGDRVLGNVLGLGQWKLNRAKEFDVAAGKLS